MLAIYFDLSAALETGGTSGSSAISRIADELENFKRALAVVSAVFELACYTTGIEFSVWR